MEMVVQVLFDKEMDCPVFVLEDGTKMYPFYSVGGQGISLEWLTEEEIKRRKDENNK